MQSIEMRRPDPGVTKPGKWRVTLIVCDDQNDIWSFCRHEQFTWNGSKDDDHCGNKNFEVWFQ
jgi:hypothetical protein